MLCMVPAQASSLPALSYTAGLEALRLDGRLALRLSLKPNAGYYFYAHEGDSARPATVRLLGYNGEPLPAAVDYPKGTLRPDYFEKDKQVLAYEGPFSITVFPESPDILPEKVKLHFSGLMCSAVSCQPVNATFSLIPPATPLEEADASSPPEAGQARQASLPVLSTLAPLPAMAIVPLAGSPTTQQIKDMAPVADLPPLPEFSPRYTQAQLEPQSLTMALVFGLLAGLVLNVMPCVLPVLTIKVSGLLHASGSENPVSRLARFREHNLFFALGILLWFAFLALLAAAFDMAWGGLFQSTGVVYGLLLLVFVLSLSMFDVFTLPMVDFKVNASHSPRLQATVSGLAATLLATPCSGPLLGGVLGWVAMQPAPIIVLVFVTTGLGMALPYLVFAAWPGAVRLLPRPGAWTGTMERLVGFFLAGTALYLLSILPTTLHLPVLVVLLVTALAAWLWGQWADARASTSRRLLVRAVAGVMVATAVWWSLQPAPVAVWQPYDPARFRAELGQRNLMVEFTADWCPSCKALERTVLTPSLLGEVARTHELTLIRVDLTRPHAEGDALLRALGSVSLPLTALFPKGDEATAPLVLRDLYTTDQLREALGQLP